MGAYKARLILDARRRGGGPSSCLLIVVLSTTFKDVLDLNPYDGSVEKLECYLHFKKRMGTHCRHKNKKVKGLGGRSKDTAKLTDKMINKFQKHYGLAMLRHQDSVEEMYKEIWSTYFHMGSTDNKP